MRVFLRLFNFGKLSLVSMTVFFLIAGTRTVLAYSDDELLASIKDFDTEYRNLTSEVFTRHASNNLKANASPVNSDYDRYFSGLSKQINENNHFQAMTSIYAHLDLIKDNVDNENTISIVEFLLSQNDYNTALVLKEKTSEYAEEYLIAKVALLFASYHNKRNEWQAVLASLDIEFELLTNEEVEQAYLLNGIALQRLKQHRKAINVYEQISESSKFYPLAQVNMAIAYIRQD
ncbi:MAG: hypothetical protein OQJ89_12795, partial [Kangiellaceae bacterium]|nr:hypothetical protein [Kangiellaceae bacterium]